MTGPMAGHSVTSLDLGASLWRLARAKEQRGSDVTITSSWCSDQSVWVARVRRKGQHAHAAKTRVGPIAEVLAWAAEEAER